MQGFEKDHTDTIFSKQENFQAYIQKGKNLWLFEIRRICMGITALAIQSLTQWLFRQFLVSVQIAAIKSLPCGLLS